MKRTFSPARLSSTSSWFSGSTAWSTSEQTSLSASACDTSFRSLPGWCPGTAYRLVQWRVPRPSSSYEEREMDLSVIETWFGPPLTTYETPDIALWSTVNVHQQDRRPSGKAPSHRNYTFVYRWRFVTPKVQTRDPQIRLEPNISKTAGGAI